MTTQSKSLRLADFIARERCAWPGGYALFGIADDGACLCHKCCETERESIGTTTGRDGWCLVAADYASNYDENELDACAHCGAAIE